MIEGIQILSETTSTSYPNSLTPAIVCLIVSIVFFALMCISVYHELYTYVTVGIIGAILFGILFTTLYSAYSQRIEFIVYKVTISDSVKLNEFNNKYQIIKQEGKIYTIVEKK